MPQATQYILHLCDVSGEHRAIARFTSPTPFHSFHVGERFDDTGWKRLDGVDRQASPEKPIRYTIHSIKHLVQENATGVIVEYCVNLQPYEGPPSPVWRE
ncbi:MAG TPA: hypothetical protein VNQ90_01265 [Chthoniobacteraceae bacterium]|nr:hypothetical protein [Chthoniobacteraceae bacterium]